MTVAKLPTPRTQARILGGEGNAPTTPMKYPTIVAKMATRIADQVVIPTNAQINRVGLKVKNTNAGKVTRLPVAKIATFIIATVANCGSCERVSENLTSANATPSTDVATIKSFSVMGDA